VMQFYKNQILVRLYVSLRANDVVEAAVVQFGCGGEEIWRGWMGPAERCEIPASGGCISSQRYRTQNVNACSAGHAEKHCK